jgi:hypothetical protein
MNGRISRDIIEMVVGPTNVNSSPKLSPISSEKVSEAILSFDDEFMKQREIFSAAERRDPQFKNSLPCHRRSKSGPPDTRIAPPLDHILNLTERLPGYFSEGDHDTVTEELP